MRERQAARAQGLSSPPTRLPPSTSLSGPFLDGYVESVVETALNLRDRRQIDESVLDARNHYFMLFGQMDDAPLPIDPAIDVANTLHARASRDWTRRLDAAIARIRARRQNQTRPPDLPEGNGSAPSRGSSTDVASDIEGAQPFSLEDETSVSSASEASSFVTNPFADASSNQSPRTAAGDSNSSYILQDPFMDGLGHHSRSSAPAAPGSPRRSSNDTSVPDAETQYVRPWTRRAGFEFSPTESGLFLAADVAPPLRPVVTRTNLVWDRGELRGSPDSGLAGAETGEQTRDGVEGLSDQPLRERFGRRRNRRG